MGLLGNDLRVDPLCLPTIGISTLKDHGIASMHDHLDLASVGSLDFSLALFPVFVVASHL